MARVDKDKVARMLVDATQLGDRKAAEKWKVSERTIRNHRIRARKDQAVAASFRERSAEVEEKWHVVRNRFLRETTSHLLDLCKQCGPDKIEFVTEAIKQVGELDIATEMLTASAADQGKRDVGAGDRGKSAPAAAAAVGSDRQATGAPAKSGSN